MFSSTVGRQLLELGLVDELALHIAPVLLGDGIRLFDKPGGATILLEHASDGAFTELDVRYKVRKRD